jgi:hypothetical protein
VILQKLKSQKSPSLQSRPVALRKAATWATGSSGRGRQPFQTMWSDNDAKGMSPMQVHDYSQLHIRVLNRRDSVINAAEKRDSNT